MELDRVAQEMLVPCLHACCYARFFPIFFTLVHTLAVACLDLMLRCACCAERGTDETHEATRTR